MLSFTADHQKIKIKKIVKKYAGDLFSEMLRLALFRNALLTRSLQYSQVAVLNWDFLFFLALTSIFYIL